MSVYVSSPTLYPKSYKPTSTTGGVSSPPKAVTPSPTYNNAVEQHVMESKVGRSVWKQYLPFIVFIIVAVLLILSILFIPTKTNTKLFAASTALAWTSFWGTVIYIACITITKNTVIIWGIVFFPLFIWSIITIMVYIGAINLDATAATT
jgi:hypothetical protein